MSGSDSRHTRRALERRTSKRAGKRSNVLTELGRKVDAALEEARTLPRPQAGALLRQRANVWRTQALAADNRGDRAAAEVLLSQEARLRDAAVAYGPADHPGVRIV